MNTYRKILFPFNAALAAAGLVLSGCGQGSDEGGSGSSAEKALSGSPDEAIKTVIHSLGNGEGAVLWQAMPGGYQNDVTEIVQLAGSKLDAEIYDKAFAMLGKTMSVADKQKEFIFNTNLGTPMAEEDIEKMREAFPSASNLVNTLTSSSIASTEGLKSFDGKTFFRETVSSIIADMEVLARLNPETEDLPISAYKEAEVVLLEGDESTANLEINLPDGSSEEEIFVKVENRWVPQEMSLEWPTSIADARAQLESIDPEQMAEQKPQILSVFSMIDGVLLQIEAAETQEQFDQALQGAMMPIMGLIMMGQGMGGGMPETPPAPSMPTEPETPSVPVNPGQ
ncbi:MAG: hypothetical protein ACLFS1_04470 [Opitutales bacterium]